MIGSVFRITLFLYALFVPILNEAGQPVSAHIVQQGIDFSFYQQTAEKLFSRPFSEITDSFKTFYDNPFEGHYDLLIAGPVVPVLIIGFEYRQGNTLPLALFYLGLGIGLLWLWLFWLRGMGAPKILLLLFALLPNPLWFTLNLSSDLPFAACMVVFYLTYFDRQGENRHWIVWGIALLLLVMTRPNGLSILLFVLIHQTIRAYQQRSIHIPAFACLSTVTLAAGIYLLPYFSAVLHALPREHASYTYFGYSTQVYFGGIFDLLPKWLDWPLSWLTLLGAKLLYFVGLRPSYGEVAWWIVTLRAGAGLILLPGLVWTAVRGDTKHRLLIGLFLLPFIGGPSQDRYNLAIQPLLFYFGYLAYRDIFTFGAFIFAPKLRQKNLKTRAETTIPSSD